MTATSTTTSGTASSSVSASSTSSVTPPAPTQSGIPANCDQYGVAEGKLQISSHPLPNVDQDSKADPMSSLPAAGDTCDTFAAEYNITEADFLAWNPAVSPACTTGFLADEAYCVGVSGSSSTTSPSTTTSATATSVISSPTMPSATPPAPTQSGIPSNCDAYFVAQGELILLPFVLFSLLSFPHEIKANILSSLFSHV
jgi:hypothetical protein